MDNNKKTDKLSGNEMEDNEDFTINISPYDFSDIHLLKDGTRHHKLLLDDNGMEEPKYFQAKCNVRLNTSIFLLRVYCLRTSKILR